VAVLPQRAVALRVTGSMQGFDAGRPLEVRPCGASVALGAGPATVTVDPTTFRPLLIQLTSPAPAPLARLAAGSGEIVSIGRRGRSSYDDVRVRVAQPSWLVLGQSYNSGWHASCNGRSIGAPQVIDGFANGWLLRPRCQNLSLWFGPQSTVDIGYYVSAAACLVLLLVLLLRTPARRASAALPALDIEDTHAPWPVVAALVAGAAWFGVFTALSGARVGAVVGVAVAFILWRGFADRIVILLAGAALVIIVSGLYLVKPGADQGGYDASYPNQHILAHAVVAAALALLILVLVRGPLNRATRRLASIRASRRRGGAAPRPAP